MKKTIALILVLILALGACALAENVRRYTFVCPLVGNEYFALFMDGVKQADEEFGCDTQMVGSTTADQEEILDALAAAVAAKVDGILMPVHWPDTQNAGLLAAKEAGIPVVAVDADDEGSGRLAFAGTNPYEAGYKAGEAMIAGTGGTAKIAVLTSGVGSGGKLDQERDGKTISTYNREEITEDRVIADMVGRSFDSYYPKETVPIGDVALELKNFSVAHPFAAGKKIIDDVSLNVRRGEILGIAGLVGAGRSELMNAAFGKDPRLAGEVLVEGRSVVIRSPEDAMRVGIGLVTEDRKKDGIIGNMTIRENLTLPNLDAVSSHGVLNLKKEKEFAQKYYDDMGVRATDMEAWLVKLSGGNQQKVVLGKWVARVPKILILDEPTRGVDVGAKYEIYRIMVDLAKKGVAIIMISSELPELLSMSDRVVIIAGGKIRGEMPASECSQESIMALATQN